MEVSVPRSMAADSMPFGRVGIDCDSLSSAALQIKSQEPSLLGKASPWLLLLAESSPDVCSAIAPHTSSEGSQDSETVPFAPNVATVTDSPEEVVSVRTRYSGLRSCRLVSASGFPRSRRSPRSPSPDPLQSLRLHLQHQLARAAGLSRSDRVTVGGHTQRKCKWRSDRYPSPQPHPVRHLPRRTGLPARCFTPS